MIKKLPLVLSVLFCFTLANAQQISSPLNKNIEVDSYSSLVGPETSAGIVFLAQLHGKVTNQNGQTIPRATVLVMELGSGTTTTDAGLYSFTVPPSAYRIQYSFIGCETVETKANLIKDTTYKLDVQLNCELSALQPKFSKFRTIKNRILCAKLEMTPPFESLEGSYIRIPDILLK